MKFSRYASNPSFVLGFHGCEQDIASKVLAGEQELQWSENNYDWLGHGVYFWENDPDRAFAWAEENKKIKEPAVVGAIIDLGLMLSLLQKDHIALVEESFQFLKAAFEGDEEKRSFPENRGGSDSVIRELDCAVIEALHLERREFEEPAFDTVRGMFPEGEPIYERAGFRRENHVQICVRNHDCIKGYFRPVDG